MKTEAIKLAFFISWCLSLFFSGIQIKNAILYLLVLLGCAGGLFVSDLQIKVLSWFFSIWIAFLITSSEGKRCNSGLAQKYFMIQLLGALTVILGVALRFLDHSMILILCGMLLVIPTFLHALFFNKFFNSLSKRAFIFSILIPAMVGVDILFTVKPEIKQSYPLVWDAVLLSVGCLSLCFSSFVAAARNETKSLLIAMSLAWLGVLFILLPSENINLLLALASNFIFIVNFFMLYVEVRECDKKYFGIMTSFFYGLPIFIGFNAFFYSIKSIQDYSVWLSFVFILAFIFQAGGVILNLKKVSINETRQKMRSKTRLLIFTAISIVAALTIHIMGMNNVVG